MGVPVGYEEPRGAAESKHTPVDVSTRLVRSVSRPPERTGLRSLIQHRSVAYDSSGHLVSTTPLLTPRTTTRQGLSAFRQPGTIITDRHLAQQKNSRPVRATTVAKVGDSGGWVGR